MTTHPFISRLCLALSAIVVRAEAFNTSPPFFPDLFKQGSRFHSLGSVHDNRCSGYHEDFAQKVVDMDMEADNRLRYGYLERIGFTTEESTLLIDRGPNMKDLQRLLSAHQSTVPFENMDQHSHPAHGDTEAVPRRSPQSLPTLDVYESLKKIVQCNRGGVCFELNFSFAWLLRSLGYTVRLALADVGCSQAVPQHVVLLVDGLSTEPLLVDVGFGSPGVCEEVLPVVYNKPKEVRGDLFRFAPDEGLELHPNRLDTSLYRTRVTAPNVQEPMYRFHSKDDLSFDAAEFKEGLNLVLTTSEFFNTKRICVLSTDQGHVTLGRDYIKWVERGETVKRQELSTETEWRAKLAQYFGVILRREEQDC